VVLVVTHPDAMRDAGALCRDDAHALSRCPCEC
jgi:hypothetical protein